jgi:hypothetical protein
VAHQFLHDFGMNAATEQMACCGVPEVVDPDSREGSLIERSMKPLGHPGSISRLSDRRREYQARVVPLTSCRDLVLDLAPAMIRQGAKRPGREVYATSPAFSSNGSMAGPPSSVLDVRSIAMS